MAMLTVENLNVYYGMIHALKGLSFHVDEGEIVALIGANGAGKTTTLQTVSGILPAKSGSINFQGKEISSVPGNQIVKLGMSHVPEGRRMFSNLTVYENLMMGAYTRKNKKEIADPLEMVYERFPRLRERTRQLAGTLSGGEQQMLAMGRALMAQPRIILMDEPSMGLSPLFVTEIFKIITEVNKQGVTILLVEQNAKKRFPSPTAPTFWKPEKSLTKERPAPFLMMNPSKKRTWVNNRAEQRGKSPAR